MSMTPYNADAEPAQHWLNLLRAGTDQQKIQARERLAEIFEGRGMTEEALDLLISNVRAGVRNADIYRWMARLYRQQGDEATAMQAAAEAAKYLPPTPPPIADHTAVLPRPDVANYQQQHIVPKPVDHQAPIPGQTWQPVLDDRPRTGSGCRIAALVLAIVGGVFGLLAAIFALGIGGLAGAFGARDAELVKTLGLSATAFCILGFLGAGFALPKPTAAGVLLLVAGVGFLFSVSWFAIITTPLFLLAALFAFMGRR